MHYLADLGKLCEILVAELDGRHIDQVEAHHLAHRLIKQCPDIAQTLDSIRQRMEPASFARSA
jgi:hypothetical protein